VGGGGPRGTGGKANDFNGQAIFAGFKLRVKTRCAREATEGKKKDVKKELQKSRNPCYRRKQGTIGERPSKVSERRGMGRDESKNAARK